MKGDFTRSTFERTRHYSSVRMQQGRVPMDADWNEAQDIGNYLDSLTRSDVIGPCGFPEDNAGFELIVEEGEIRIGAGRGYVGGSVIENDDVVAIAQQPHLPEYAMPETEGLYVAYLDVWQRHITAIDDPNIKEIALGGPDTATRSQTIWQVKLKALTDTEDNSPTCQDLGETWQPSNSQNAGHLRSRVTPSPLEDRPCIIPASAGFRRLENQLYRVEIHQGSESGTPTFKWSRENGTIASRWTGPNEPNTNKLTVEQAGRDSVLRFQPNSWIELSDDATELGGTPGRLVKLDQVEGQQLTIDGTATRPDGYLTPKIRQWDHQEQPGQTLIDGAIALVEGQWLPLEDGVEVWFEPSVLGSESDDDSGGNVYRTGDYWLIPARTMGAQVLWPTDDNLEPLPLPPEGIEHQYCALGILRLTGSTWERLQDCRPLFPPLTDLPSLGGCCTRVAPGEDIQRAVDRAIAAGGGCICLGHGIHTLDRPLRLTQAHSVSISGETPLTVLKLEGRQETEGREAIARETEDFSEQLGVILLEGTTNVTINQLIVFGENLISVIHCGPATSTTSRQTTNTDLSLTNLKIINSSSDRRAQNTPFSAIRLSAAERVRIEACQLVANVGILSVNGERLPSILEEQEQVEEIVDVHIKQVTVLYGLYGVWAVSADRWHIDHTTLRPRPSVDASTLEKASTETDNRSISQLPSSTQSRDLKLVQKLIRILNQLRRKPSQSDRGTALKAFIWKNSQISNSFLQGDRAVETAWCLESHTENNHIHSKTLGLYAFWLHNTQWNNNRLICTEGTALSWMGTHRATLQHNRVRNSAIGIANINSDRAVERLAKHLREVQGSYLFGTGPKSREQNEILVIALLFNQLARIWQLSGLLRSFQGALTQNDGKATALFLISRTLFNWLNNPERQNDALLSVIIGLKIENNNIEARKACIYIQGFWSLGGITIRQNRLHTILGQALRLNAYDYAVNAFLVAWLWRYVARLIQEQLPKLSSTVSDQLTEATSSALTPEQRAAIEALLAITDQLQTQVTQWKADSEGFLEPDYRIEGNQIRSLDTAIATNLFEISAVNNHITLQERATNIQSLVAVIESLKSSTVLRPLAIALQTGASQEISTTLEQLKANLTTRDQRAGIATALTDLISRISNTDPALSAAATNLVTAINQNAASSSTNSTIANAISSFTAALSSYQDSYGMLIQGIGSRIESNHILVPTDTQTSTWSRGGLRLSVNRDKVRGLLIIASAIQRSLASADNNESSIDNAITSVDPLLGITETLVDNNEILGGIGHGIGIQGSDVPEFLSKIKLRGNQISGMGGAGIYIDETAFVANLDIENNRVFDCANQPQIAAITTAQGGIEIAGAIFCRLSNNRINGCGNVNLKASPFAINLETIFDLTLSDNSIQYNISGGVRLANVFGIVSVNSNNVSRNQGIGFLWENGSEKDLLRPRSAETDGSSTGAESEISTRFVVQAISPLITLQQFAAANKTPVPRDITKVQASIQNNQFHVPDEQTEQAFVIVGLNELIFSGNMASRPGSSPVGFIGTVEIGSITNNLLRNRI
ncbi:MAG: DUF6519 domain-containing protein [Cyanobacteria bacterium J06560_6]